MLSTLTLITSLNKYYPTINKCDKQMTVSVTFDIQLHQILKDFCSSTLHMCNFHSYHSDILTL